MQNHYGNGYDPNFSPLLASAEMLTIALVAMPETAWPIVRSSLTEQMLPTIEPVDMLRKVYAVCSQLEQDGREPSITNIIDNLNDDERNQLYKWRECQPYSLNAERIQDWVEAIRESYKSLQLGSYLAETAVNLQSKQIDLAEAISNTQAALDSVTSGAAKTSKAKDYTERYIKYLSTPNNSVFTGIDALDTYTGGLMLGDLNTIAARPGGGKTDFALWIARYIAEGGDTVLYISMELSEVEINERLFASAGMINGRALRDKTLTAQDKTKAQQTAQKLAQLPLYILDAPSQTAAGIERAIMQTKPKVVFVDNLDLVRPMQRNTLRNYEIEEVCHSLKSIAKRCNCCIVALAQANRRTDQIGKPTLADLYGSSAIEHDSSFVLMLAPAAHPESSGSIDGLILKARRGRTGEVALQADFQYHRWREVS